MSLTRHKFAVAILLSSAAAIGGGLLLSRGWSADGPDADGPPHVRQTVADDVAVAVATVDMPVPPKIVPERQISEPIVGALGRVSKKPFGLYVRPGESPVSPERFRGYHVGTDFETVPAEQETDVTVFALCDGPLVLKKRATGYGGVAVQSCRLAGQDVTVVYGHLRLASVVLPLQTALKRGAPLGVLGTGFSSETDGERKHLHLGIHRGTAIDVRGYVQTRSELNDWLDPLPLLAE